MGNNFRNDRGGRKPFDRGGFGRKNFDRGQGRGRERQMYKAVCSNCGKDCEVPFRPTNTKPVYCSDCFEKMGGGPRSDRQSDRPRFTDRRPQGGSNPDQFKAQLENLNSKLDRIIRLLEPKTQAPEPVKPVDPIKVIPETVKEVNKAVKESEEIVVMESPKAKKASKKKTPAKKK